jgi:hypothetical protein
MMDMIINRYRNEKSTSFKLEQEFGDTVSKSKHSNSNDNSSGRMLPLPNRARAYASIARFVGFNILPSAATIF